MNPNTSSSFCGRTHDHNPHTFGEAYELYCSGYQREHFYQTITLNGKHIAFREPYITPFHSTVVTIGIKDLLKSLFLWRKATIRISDYGDRFAQLGVATINWEKIVEQSKKESRPQTRP